LSLPFFDDLTDCLYLTTLRSAIASIGSNGCFWNEWGDAVIHDWSPHSLTLTECGFSFASGLTAAGGRPASELIGLVVRNCFHQQEKAGSASPCCLQ
jgi:hypothetical protein